MLDSPRRKYRLRRQRYRETEMLPDSTPRRAPQAAANGNGTAPQTPTPTTPVISRIELEMRDKHIRKIEDSLKALKESSDVELKAAREAVAQAHAEMESQRKRLVREREDLRKLAAQDMIQKLIAPMDHFDLAMQNMPQAQDLHSIIAGVELIYRQMASVLEHAGMERICTAGVPFDPNVHDAVSTAPTNDHALGNHVAAILRPGYTLHGRVLRAAMVQVYSAPEHAKAAQSEEDSARAKLEQELNRELPG